jgi:hypothetical protein
MWLLTINGKEQEGAYSATNEDGEQVLYLFEEEDDAVRFAMMLEEMDYPEMHVIEIDDDLIIKTCDVQGYLYTIITPNDIVIPPEEYEGYDFI